MHNNSEKGEIANQPTPGMLHMTHFSVLTEATMARHMARHMAAGQEKACNELAAAAHKKGDALLIMIENCIQATALQ